MAESFFDRVHRQDAHTPDVLSCLANLSNDEVFTPPEIVNQMLDSLPQELFESTETTFLDPACKTGVFLREIAKRLLNAQIPNYQDRVAEINDKKALGALLSTSDNIFMETLQAKIDHIFHNQLYGIAITELTSLLSRRSVYCSMYPNGKYSISKFDNAEGNIRFRRIQHTWVGSATYDEDGNPNRRCVYCGANEAQWKRDDVLETHAYEFIHKINIQEALGMAFFDVIISNPPYQLNSGGGGRGSGTAIPIYNLFVEHCKKLNPRYMTMIIPARWYSGGRGLESFRKGMLEDVRITKIVDYLDSRECFPGVDVAGGICYFLWDRSHEEYSCEIENHYNGNISREKRPLNEYEIFIRNNHAVDIVKKVSAKAEKTMDSVVSPVSLYGFNSNSPLKKNGKIKVRNVNGIRFCEKHEIRGGLSTIDQYKVIISAAAHDHGGQPDKEGKRRIISRIEILEPGTICTATYIVVSSFDTKEECENLISYLKTQFVRFLMSQVCISQHISRDTFKFVPVVDFNQKWTDAMLFQKYKINDKEIEYINSVMRNFPNEGGDE